MNFPAELKYSKSHEWVQVLDKNTVVIGITDYAQSAMGDLVFINLPLVGDEVEKDQVLGDIESVKAVSDVLSPVSGTVMEINEELLDAPQLLNEEPYGAWIAKIGDINDCEELMDSDAYEAFIAEA
ncbi:MAG: glycine cleavage system protein GcvH [Oscillospiraceae bacterium]